MVGLRRVLAATIGPGGAAGEVVRGDVRRRHPAVHAPEVRGKLHPLCRADRVAAWHCGGAAARLHCLRSSCLRPRGRGGGGAEGCEGQQQP